MHTNMRKPFQRLLAIALSFVILPGLLPMTAFAASSEQFSLAPGGTYYFDLSAQGVPGTLNTGLPDTSLKWVPFTYAGTVNAYSLGASSSGDTSASGNATASDRSLFVADYNISHTVSWNALNSAGLIFGKAYSVGGVDYTLRFLSVGSIYNNQSGAALRGTPETNEWDQLLNKDGAYLKNWSRRYSWGQDTITHYATYRAFRGYYSARHWASYFASYVDPYYGFRPALEILNPAALGADGLKTVTYDMDGNGTLGSGSRVTATVVYTGDLTLPEITSANGFTYTGTGTGVLGWYAGADFHPAGTSPELDSGTILKAGREPGVPTTDAATPSITGQPAGATYAQNEPAAALSVTASITDNGTLSYQWYKNTGNSTTGGTAVGINSSNYTPPTDTVGTIWYYCVVTNTNPGATGNQTAAAASNTAAVTVNAPGTALVTGVSLNKATLSLYSNTAPNTATLIATVTPSDAANKTVAWQSGNIGAATVDASGKVTAVGNGTATITATTADGGYTASCTVTVTTYSGGSGSSGGDYTPPDTIVHNTIYPGASTIWLSGRGLSSGDLLIAKPLTSGGSYKALFTLADQDDVLGVYDISLRSGTTSTGSALHLTFSIGAKYAGQTLTLVHQKEDGGFEYFFATADASGNVKFGPLYSLSPFMLVKGTMLNTLRNEGTGIPKTGDNFSLLPFALLALAALCGAGTMVIRKRRTPRRYIAWCNRQIRHYDRALC